MGLSVSMRSYSSNAAREVVQHILHPVAETGRHIVENAAGPDVGERDARPADQLEDIQDLLALAQGVHQQGMDRAGDVHRMRAQPHQVRRRDAVSSHMITRSTCARGGISTPMSFSTARQ